MNSGTDNAYLFTKLKSGDKLMGKGIVNSCSKSYTSTFNINTAYSAAFTYSRNWRTYTFKANDTQSTVYNWYIDNVPKGNSKTLTEDMWNYKSTNVTVALSTSDISGCSDSTAQIVAVPNLSEIHSIQSNTTRIYPNPFNEILTIETNLDDFELEMTDIAGRQMLLQVQGNTIYTGALSSGLYFVRLKKDGKVLYQDKFVKY